MLLSTLLLEHSPKNVQKYESVLRFLIDPIPITLRHLLFRCLILHVAIKFIARKFTKKCAKIWACNRIINWPNIYHRCLILHVQVVLLCLPMFLFRQTWWFVIKNREHLCLVCLIFFLLFEHILIDLLTFLTNIDKTKQLINFFIQFSKYEVCLNFRLVFEFNQWNGID